MDTYSASVTQSLFTSTKEPLAELRATVLILNLLIILQVICHDKSRALSMPLTATNLLFTTTRQDSELGSICPLHDDVGGGSFDEVLDAVVAPEELVLVQLRRHIPQVLAGHLLTRAYDDYIVFYSEADIR